MKKNNLSTDKYRELFCEHVEFDNRQPVYVSMKTHVRLKKAVYNMGVYGLSISSFIENILTHHLNVFDEQMKEIEKQEHEKLFGTDED